MSAPWTKRGRRPEVDRTELRNLLIDGVAPANIRWGHKLASVAALPTGEHELTFTNGHRATVDLVVGADGAWSKVRRLVSDALPIYSGLSFLEFHFTDVDATQPAVGAFIGRGMLFALSHEQGMIAHRNGDGSATVYAALRVPSDWASATSTDWRAALLDAYVGWSPELLRLVHASDPTVVPRAIYALPVGHEWSRVPSVTLLGDAAHLMSPFAGEGANLAMQDGAELAREIVATPGDLNAALGRYEAAMFPQSAAAAAESAKSLRDCLAENAPHPTLAMMAGRGPG